MNKEINFTYVNLGLLLLFLCNLGSIHGHFTRFCGSLFVRCCFPTQSKARQVTVCSLNSQISPASKNRALINHETVKSLRHGQFLTSSPSHGYCDAFFEGNLFETFCMRETRWTRVEWWTQPWTQANRVVNIIPPTWETHIPVICFPPNGKHISLVMCVLHLGNTHPQWYVFPHLGNKYISRNMCSPTWETHIRSDLCSPTWETHITNDLWFPTWKTHIPSDMCSPTWETDIPSDMCSPTWETHLPSDMCSPTSETHIPSEMCSPTWETHIRSDLCSPTWETHIPRWYVFPHLGNRYP